MNQPLVSVNVLMYNSSEYILETLESIKAQTYPNIELIVSDDKSTDNTVQLCEDWIAKNKSRFADVKLLVPDHNTGQSGNYNRAFRAATGEWIKEIDGDDILLPNCLTDLVEYANAHPEAKYIFGHMTGFGADEKKIEDVLRRFDYSFFDMSPEDQLHRLLYKGNCIPSPTVFYNRQYVVDLGFENDERIPNLEDWPKWIALLRLGVRFTYFPQNIASYRVDSGVSTNTPSERYFRSCALMNAYYCYPQWYKDDPELAAQLIAEQSVNRYRQVLSAMADVKAIQNSPSFRLGCALLAPIKWLREHWKMIVR